jgi:ubiquinone/menaquinone biosynthesis C-methylase UbiE
MIAFLLYDLIVSFLQKMKIYDMREIGYSSIISSLISDDDGNETILDVGVGSGYIANRLCPKKEKFIVGLDVNKKILKSNKLRLFHPVAADAHHMPFQDEVFDVTLLISCVEHLAQPQTCIKEVSRITRQKGLCITQLPNLQWLMEPHTKFPFLYFMPRPLSLVIKKSSGYDSLNLNVTLKKVLSFFDNFGFANISRRDIRHFKIFIFSFWPLGWFLVFRRINRK